MDTDHLCSRNVEGDNGSYHNSFNLFASWEVSPPKGWLWRSWQSGCFRHHRSVVRIPTLAISYLKHIGQLISRRDQNKEKEAENDQLKKVYLRTSRTRKTLGSLSATSKGIFKLLLETTLSF